MATRLFRHCFTFAITVVAISACAFVSLHALSSEYKTTYLSFNTPVELPGVGLAPGLWSTLYLAALLVLSVLTVQNRALSAVAEADEKRR